MLNNVVRIIGITLLLIGLVGATVRLVTMTIVPAVYPFLSIVAYVSIALVGGGLYDWSRNRDEGKVRADKHERTGRGVTL